MRILMVGLDAAGKTTILYKLKLGEGESKLWEESHCYLSVVDGEMPRRFRFLI